MIFSLFILFQLVFVQNGTVPEAWSERLTEKVFASVELTYETNHVELMEVADQITTAPSRADFTWNNHLFAAVSGDQVIGYAFVDQAPSMKDVFDYIVLFDSDLSIVNTKVLIYREQHGRQIGAKRWLNQFTGMSVEDKPELGTNIDGISGATISVTSMTKAVNVLLSELSVVKNEIVAQ